MSERRPHWTDDLIEAVYAELPAKKYQVEPDSWEVHRIIAAVEDWARWEHVPKGTLARLEQAEAAIARVRELHTPHRCQMSTRHTNCSINFDGGCSRKSKCQVCRVDYPCATVRALDGGAE